MEQLAKAPEIDIETMGRRTGRTRRATVWAVVADGVPYVRSEFGDAGQWYRNALAAPRIGVVVGGRRFAAAAVPVTDPSVWQAVSEAFRVKYRRSSSVGVMVEPAIEPMTLALEPAAEPGTAAESGDPGGRLEPR